MLPTEEQIIQGLRSWIDSDYGPKRSSIADLWLNYEQRTLGQGNQPTLTQRSLQTLLQGKRALKYSDLTPIFDIFKIKNPELFFDFCIPPTLSQVKLVPQAVWITKPIDDVSNPKCRITFPRLQNLAEIKTRLDTTELHAGGKTKWNSHDGHEFVFVLKGSVYAVFSETSAIDGDLREEFVSQDSAVYFPSSLFHRFENRSTEVSARLAIARPSLSTPVTTEGT